MEQTNTRKSAKFIAKTLRKEGVKTRVLKWNGTTNVYGMDKCDAHFDIGGDEWNTIYLSFEMTEEMVQKITNALIKHEIPFHHDGSVGRCFAFHPAGIVANLKEAQ